MKTEPDQAPREGAKKTLFPPQPPGKEYYPNYDSYYSPTYPNASPAAPPLMEGVQVKKEEESEVRAELVINNNSLQRFTLLSECVSVRLAGKASRCLVCAADASEPLL